VLEGLEQRWVPSTVTNNNDSGPGSLRAAIASAHNGETINFAPSLNGQTITLTSGELLIKKGLTISGPGASLLAISGNAISGNNGSRVFDVSSPTKQQVTLSGLTLENGNGVGGGQNGYGGAVENFGTLTINNCIITNDPQGGGIDNETGATLTVNNTTVSNNTGLSGIYNQATLTVSGCTISGNSTRGSGGGIASIIGTLTVTNSTLSNNHSAGGGGIWNQGSTATISGCTLSGNSAPYGGAIRNDAVSLTLSGCTLFGNSATARGGAIAVEGGTVTVSGCTIGSPLAANTAALAGGGIWIDSGATVTVQNSSTITGNSAPVGSGADVYNNGVLHVDATSTIGVLDGNPATIPLWAFDRK
jgi:hypothetical protein